MLSRKRPLFPSLEFDPKDSHSWMKRMHLSSDLQECTQAFLLKIALKSNLKTMTYQFPPTPPPPEENFSLVKTHKEWEGWTKTSKKRNQKQKEIALLAPGKPDFKSNTVKLGKESNWMMIRGWIQEEKMRYYKNACIQWQISCYKGNIMRSNSAVIVGLQHPTVTRVWRTQIKRKTRKETSKLVFL